MTIMILTMTIILQRKQSHPFVSVGQECTHCVLSQAQKLKCYKSETNNLQYLE